MNFHCVFCEFLWSSIVKHHVSFDFKCINLATNCELCNLSDKNKHIILDVINYEVDNQSIYSVQYIHT